LGYNVIRGKWNAGIGSWESQLATYLAQKRTRVCVSVSVCVLLPLRVCLGQMPTHKTCHKSTGGV